MEFNKISTAGNSNNLEIIDQEDNTSETNFIMSNKDRDSGMAMGRETNIEINMEGEDTSYCGSCVSTVIFIFSALLICLTFPFSLCVCIKMVQVLMFLLFLIFFNYYLSNSRAEKLLFYGFRASAARWHGIKSVHSSPICN